MPIFARLSSRRRSRAFAPSLILLALLTACGGSDGPTTPPAAVDLTGDWAWSISGATGGNAVCSVNNVTLTFTQTTSGLSGGFTAGGNGNVTCVIGGSQNQTTNFAGSTLLTGLSRNGGSITFSFSATSGPWVSSGNITGNNRMSGTATIRLSASGTVVVFTGPWVATRL